MNCILNKLLAVILIPQTLFFHIQEAADLRFFEKNIEIFRKNYSVWIRI